MEQFSEGDFIRIKDIQKYSESLVNDESIIYQISAIKNGLVKVTGCNQMIPIYDLDPVPLSSKPEDIIYCINNIPMGSLINPCGDKPRIGSDQISYYKHDVIQQYINDNGFRYIHELQHFLEEQGVGELQYKI